MSANVSNAYKEQFNRNVRNPSYVKITMGLGDEGALQSASFTSSSALFNNSGKALEGLKLTTNPKKYASLEEGFLKLDGSMMFVPDTTTYNESQKYVGNQLYNSGFSSPQNFSMELPSPRYFYGLEIGFDTSLSYFPTKIEVSAYRSNILISDKVYDNNDYRIVIEDAYDLIDKLTIRILETKENTRARVAYINLGLSKEFELKDILSTTERKYIDSLSTNLPASDFKFKILNINHIYDIDNPQGFYKYIENSRNPVVYEYGYELDNGTIEWIKGGETLTVGEMSTSADSNNTTATFITLDYLNYMDDLYYLGEYKNSTFYDLAVSVFENSELPRTREGNPRYYVDESLKKYSTSIPLPVMEGKNLIKLIANACCCILYVDRNGIIRIEPMNTEVEDFYLDFNKARTSPTLLKKYPLVFSIQTSLNSTTVSTTEELLLDVTLPETGTKDLEFTYTASSNVRVAVSNGTLNSSKLYARYGKLNVSANNNCNIKIYGKPLRFSTMVVSNNLNSTGEIFSIENELIDDFSQLEEYLVWLAKYAKIQNKYSVDYVGNPEIDAGRFITAQTRFKENGKSLITESNIYYNGALSGNITFFLDNE